MVEQMIGSVRASSLADLVWVRPDGTVGASGVTALPLRDAPAAAFTYADAALAREVAAAPVAAVALSEQRSTGAGFTPMVAIGRPSLLEDLHAEVFLEDLLLEELRRYPPARRYADSPLLRREYWWYLPRLIVTLDVTDVRELPSRASPEQHLLATSGGHDLSIGLARLDDPRPESVALAPDPPVAPGPGVLFGQDASFPDLEQWSQWCYRGAWDGSFFTVSEVPTEVGLEPTPGVWQRLRRQRALGRACRRAIPR